MKRTQHVILATASKESVLSAKNVLALDDDFIMFVNKNQRTYYSEIPADKIRTFSGSINITNISFIFKYVLLRPLKTYVVIDREYSHHNILQALSIARRLFPGFNSIYKVEANFLPEEKIFKEKKCCDMGTEIQDLCSTYDFPRTLILVGLGRSGSTLLNFSLNAHQNIAMFGEASFFLPQLAQTCFSKMEHGGFARKYRMLKSIIDVFDYEPGLDEYQQWQHEEIWKTITGLRHFYINTLFHSKTSFKVLGFKEIWNGTKHFFSWNIYNIILPNVAYLHLVRDPYDFSRSYLNFSSRPKSKQPVLEALNHWVTSYQYNRIILNTTDRYDLLRFEDLLAKTEETLTKALDLVGLEYDKKMLDPFNINYSTRKTNYPLPKLKYSDIEQFPLLEQYAQNLGYDLNRFL